MFSAGLRRKTVHPEEQPRRNHGHLQGVWKPGAARVVRQLYEITGAQAGQNYRADVRHV